MYLILILVAVVAAILLFASTRPSAFHVERSLTINAPPERLFSMINDFHQWVKWSPYEKLDPNMKRTFSAASSGPGAVYAWEGNSKAGTGSVTITDESAPSRVAVDLDMLKPMEGHNKVVFALTPEAGATRVTWGMDGTYGVPARIMGVFMNMDKMIGGQFAEGLANMKRVAEGG